MPTDPNPIFDLGNPTWIKTVADGQTPGDLAQYANRYPSVAEGVQMPPLGTRGIIIVSGVSLPGYLRQGAEGYEWVIQPLVDPLDAVVDALPGPVGWSDTPSRDVWRNIARALRGYGVGYGDLGYGLPALYNAAKVNLLAEYGVE